MKSPEQVKCSEKTDVSCISLNLLHSYMFFSLFHHSSKEKTSYERLGGMGSMLSSCFPFANSQKNLPLPQCYSTDIPIPPTNTKLTCFDHFFFFFAFQDGSYFEPHSNKSFCDSHTHIERERERKGRKKPQILITRGNK